MSTGSVIAQSGQDERAQPVPVQARPALAAAASHATACSRFNLAMRYEVSSSSVRATVAQPLAAVLPLPRLERQ
jgi:hypothetical protein